MLSAAKTLLCLFLCPVVFRLFAFHLTSRFICFQGACFQEFQLQITCLRAWWLLLQVCTRVSWRQCLSLIWCGVFRLFAFHLTARFICIQGACFRDFQLQITCLLGSYFDPSLALICALRVRLCKPFQVACWQGLELRFVCSTGSSFYPFAYAAFIYWLSLVFCAQLYIKKAQILMTVYWDFWDFLYYWDFCQQCGHYETLILSNQLQIDYGYHTRLYNLSF
jgi:hypothetical protein